MTNDEILDEVRQLPQQEQMAVLERILEMVSPQLTPEQEAGLVEAMDAADAGALVDGSEAFAQQRARLLGRQ